MVQTSARLLKVLALLQSRRFWSGAELAQELGVTERSVRRDVDRLRGLGYPVHATAGVGGGYQLGAGKELPPLPLDDDEAVAVAIGLRAAAAGPVKGVEDASVRALAKLEQVLPKRLRRRVNALQAVSIRVGESHQAVDAETLTTIANACRDSIAVRFEYVSRDGAATSRSVEPYRLVHTSFRWYLLAFDLVRDDWRTFRVDRIGTKVKSGRSFTPRKLPASDVGAYVARAVSDGGYRFHARVVVHGPARAVEEKLAWKMPKVEPLGPERCLVQAGSDSLDTLAHLFAFLGFEFEVLAPAELAAQLDVLAQRLARAAGRMGGRRMRAP